MTWVAMFLVLLSAALAQALLPGWAWLAQSKVPVLLAATVYYALNHRLPVALAAAAFGGLLQDALGPIPLGYSMFCFCLVALVAGGCRRLVITEALLTQAVFGGGAALAAAVALWALGGLGGLVQWPLRWALLRVAGSTLLGIAATPVVFAAAGRLDRLVGNVEPFGAGDEA